MKKTLIKNVTIIDGSGTKGFLGSVGILDQQIDCVLSNQEIPESFKEATIVEGKGLTLTPGFIDTHSHSDLEVISRPILIPKIRQGITTEILGQDGISMAPLPLEHISAWRKNIGGLDGESETLDWTYKTVEGYFERIETSGMTTNVSYLIPHGNVRLEVLGFEDIQPTEQDIKAMCDAVRLGMENGCLGLSSGLIYIPCAYGQKEELIEMCKVVKEYEGVFVVHQRSEANQILESMDEIIDIGLKSGVKIHFSHFKICGKNNWHLLSSVLEKIDDAIGKGISVSFDMYPYTAGSTMLSATLPPWAHIGGTDKMLKRLTEPEIREKLKSEMMEMNSKWDNFVEFAGLSGIFITSTKTEKNARFIGKNLVEIGEMTHKEPVDALFDLLIEEENSVGMIDYYGSEDHIKAFVARKEMNVCTDGLLGGKAHPRAYGAFPRMISKYVYETPILSLEEAIYKMTGKPARTFRIEKRGVIKAGNYADLVLFQAENFKDIGDYVNPDQFPTGLIGVMVNGQWVYSNGVYDETPCGKLIRKDS